MTKMGKKVMFAHALENIAKVSKAGSHQRPYHFNLMERKKNGQIKRLISNMWLILLYTAQLVISDVCTKFQNPRSKFHIHYIGVR